MKKTMGTAAGRRSLPEHLKGGVRQHKCPAFSAVLLAAALAGFFAACNTGNGGGSSDAPDTWTPDGGFSGYDLASVSVSNDASNLHVSLTFENPPAIWHRGRIGILIDDPTATPSASVLPSDGWHGIANTVTASGADCYAEVLFPEYKSEEENAASAPSPECTPDCVSVSPSAWKIDSWADTPADGGRSVTVSIPLSEIGAGVSAGSSLRIFTAVSSYEWNGESGSSVITIQDCLPASAVSVNLRGAFSVDFAGALSYTVQ